MAAEYTSVKVLKVLAERPSKHCSFTHLYNEELKELNDYRINGYLHLIESFDSEIKDVSNYS
jgi:hypothetical protein